MVGIIAEYNPLHNGHLYHINKIKEMFPNEIITLVLAGHFLNRGDVSIINKWDKTLLALKYGVDLVIELPTVYATQSSDLYAYGAIKILNELNCDYLVFGSESNDIKLLKDTALKLNNDYSIKEHLKKGYSYPKSIALTYNIDINSPNDLLGISYIKAINNIKSNIEPITIKRTNDYHSLSLNNKITSATSIRACLKENINISKYIPDYNINYIKNIELNDFFNYIKYQVINNDISIYNIDIKLGHSIKKNIDKCSNIDELIDKIKCKNYTYNSIKRGLVQILLGIKKDDINLNYIRILGFNNNGQQYLNKIKKKVNLPLITNYNNLLDFEYKVTKIYSLVYGNITNKELDKPIFL